MNGLMTINTLIKSLLNEVLSGDLSKYPELLKKKSDASISIKNKSYDDKSISELRDHVLDNQIILLKFYAERIHKIDKIIGFLNRNFMYKKFKLSKETEYTRQQLVILMKEFRHILAPRVFGKNIIELIEAERDSLKQNNYAGYLSYYEKEMRMLVGVLETLKDISIDKKYLNYKKYSINQRKVYILLILIWSFNFAVWGYNISSWARYKDAKAQNVGNVSEERFSVKLDTGRTVDLMKLTKEYADSDFVDDANAELRFQDTFHLNIVGDYTRYDLEMISMVVQTVYSSNFLERLGVRRMIFVPGYIYENNNALDTSCYISGLADPNGDMTLISMRTPDDNRTGWGTFEHEFGHFIHYYLENHYPEFNKEWSKIQGGYIYGYAKTDFREDVASIIGAFMSLGRVSPDKYNLFVTCIDNNWEALKEKVDLLRKYNAFSIKLLE